MVRPVIARVFGYHLTKNSLRKCIRPLASGLLLQPGHDEIRARRFQIKRRADCPFFIPGLRHADRLFRHHPPEPRNLLGR